MTIEDAVRNIMDRSKVGQTVGDVCQKIGDELEVEVRAILIRMYKDDHLDSIHGGGSQPTHYYRKKPFEFKQSATSILHKV
jgi:hypothetical protein